MIKKRDISIDLLKTLACIAVVGLHAFTYDYNNVIINYIHYMFGFAVPIFFMVNGHLILNKESLSYKYCLIKIRNILLIVFLWNMLLVIKTFITDRVIDNVFRYIINSFLQTGFMWHFWFLGAMIITYLFAPIFHILIKKNSKNHIVLLAAAFLICAAIWIINLINGKHVIATDVFQIFKIWIWLLYFLIGGYINKIQPSITKRFSLKLHGLLTVLLFLFFPLYQLWAKKYINFNDYYSDPLAILNNIFIFTFVKRLDFADNSKVTNTIKLLSSLGMGCYIIHPILVNIIVPHMNYSYPIVSFAVWIGLLIFSYLVTWIMMKNKFTRILVNLA